MFWYLLLSNREEGVLEVVSSEPVQVSRQSLGDHLSDVMWNGFCDSGCGEARCSSHHLIIIQLSLSGPNTTVSISTCNDCFLFCVPSLLNIKTVLHAWPQSSLFQRKQHRFFYCSSYNLHFRPH